MRRVQKHESHGLEVYFSKTAFENRVIMPTIIPELKKFYKIAQDLFSFEDALIVDKLDDVPQEDELARRHARDRSRTWALAAIMERSFSSFSGQRPNTTLDVDWGTLNDWLKSPISLDGDIQVVAFLHLRRIEEIMRTPQKSFRDYKTSFEAVQFLRSLVDRLRRAGVYPR